MVDVTMNVMATTTRERADCVELRVFLDLGSRATLEADLQASPTRSLSRTSRAHN